MNQTMKSRTKTNTVSHFINKIWKSNWQIKREQNLWNFIFRNWFGDVPEMGQHSAPQRICEKTIFDGNCVSTHGAGLHHRGTSFTNCERISLCFQKTSGLPLLTQLHLFHHGLDVLNIVLLLFSRTPGFLQRPGRLVTHQLHHHRSFLPQRSQTRLCTEERQAYFSISDFREWQFTTGWQRSD